MLSGSDGFSRHRLCMDIGTQVKTPSTDDLSRYTSNVKPVLNK
jgi:hypothetical protein